MTRQEKQQRVEELFTMLYDNVNSNLSIHEFRELQSEREKLMEELSQVTLYKIIALVVTMGVLVFAGLYKLNTTPYPTNPTAEYYLKTPEGDTIKAIHPEYNGTNLYSPNEPVGLEKGHIVNWKKGMKEYTVIKFIEK